MQRLGVHLHCVALTGILWCLGCITNPAAAPLRLSDVPLFLSMHVEPNVLLIVDDSGSMDWDIMTTDALHSGLFTNTQPDGTDPDPMGSGPAKHRDDDHDGKADCTYANDMFYGYGYIAEFNRNTYHDNEKDCTTVDEQEWRARNFQFNSLYFNPFRSYKPWPGVTKDGKPFPHMRVTQASAEPYDPRAETINLRSDSSDMPDATGKRTRVDRNKDGVPDGFWFYLWHDKDQDGLFDNGEEVAYRLNRLKDGDIPGKTAVEVQQNFANWFSYHRSRMLRVKAILGELIAQTTDARIGLITLNKSANIAIQSMNPDATTGHKRQLLDGLYSIKPDQATPLPEALRQAGLYLACQSNTLFPSCPALSLEEGGACQHNVAMVITDGLYNVPLQRAVGNTDGDGNSLFDGGAYADPWLDTLADIAIQYYEHDLHPTLPDLVSRTTAQDTAPHHHMVTHLVTLAPGLGSLPSAPTHPSASFPWPQPDLAPPFTVAKAKAIVDDGRHAAYNGRGIFFATTDPAELLQGLQKAITNVAVHSGSSTPLAVNAGVHDAASAVYQAQFDSSDWSGHLLSFPLSAEGILQTPTWDAAVVLDGQHFDTGRHILTFDPTVTPHVGRAFRWHALTETQRALLSSHGTDTLGAARVDYLRGATQLAATGTFRQRRHVLGDVINAAPFFVGRPSLPESVGAGYAAFRRAHMHRTSMLLVGSNDGMLHIFAANTGTELLAYVPYAVFPHLQELTSPHYHHRFYVDASPTAGDVEVHGAWRTVAVGGLGAGGRGYYALDITEPAMFDERHADALVLWEFGSAQDADLGFTFSQPALVRMANGQWAAVFGNGYNNTGSGQAALFIVFLEQRGNGQWRPGLDYIKLTTGVGSPSTPNGLATPAVIDMHDSKGYGFGDFTADFIVAGDLQGNLWKFDVRDRNPAHWGVDYRRGTTPLPLFQARDSQGVVQPITSRPAVGVHPLDPDSFVVYFGTGKYLEATDNTVTGVGTQTVYAIANARRTPAVPYQRQTLVAQTILTTAASAAGNVRVVSQHPVDFATTSGWLLDLPLPGERQVSDPALRNGRIIFTTMIPTAQPCGVGGSGWLMELDALTGGRLDYPTFDLNNDKKFDAHDMVNGSPGGSQTSLPPSGVESPQGMSSRPAMLASGRIELKLRSDLAGNVVVLGEHPGPGAVGRQSWQQIYQ